MPSGVKIEDDSNIQSSRSDEVSTKKTATIAKSASDERPSIKKSSSKDKRDSGMKSNEVNEESVEVVLGEKGQGKVVGESSIDKSKQTPDQNVFRHPQTFKPKPMRAPNGPPVTHPPHHPIPPPHMYPPHHHQPPHGQPYPHPAYYPYPHSSGSWGYGPPPPPPPSLPHGDYHQRPHMPRPPYPVPPYSGSGSFEDQAAYHHHTPHYSPHIQYPPPTTRYPNEDVNVISPNHKVNSPPGHRAENHYRPPQPATPSRPRHLTPPQHYQYPPTSPVSRSEAPSSGAPRLRNYAMRRGEGAYSRAQADRPEDSPWSTYGHPQAPSTTNRESKNRRQAPVVAESFDSGHMSRTSHPSTPGAHHPPPTQSSSDPHYEFYGGGGSWGSFDSAGGPPPPHMDDHRYYNSYPPESPYSPYGAQYSPGPLYRADSFPSPGYGPTLPPAFSYSFDDENTRLLQDYNPDHDGEIFHKQVTPPGNSKKSGRSKNSTPIASNISDRNSVLPKAAEEVDFDVACPPMEPIVPESDEPACESLAEVNTYDVLCGRGGGTNSQIGNRRFRQLVQEFQPIYLLAKRKEKPLLARTIVLIIRKRGGRFLRKNEETQQLFEVGDTKAEAKTSQALREGLDVRATKSARTLQDKHKKKKKGTPKSPGSDTTMESPISTAKSNSSMKVTDVTPRPTDSPPTLPRLHGEVKVGDVHPHSPDPTQFRKRRRMRSADRFFVDFCPPRDEIGQAGCNPLDCGGRFEDDDDDGVVQESNSTPIRRNNSGREDDYQARGCAGIALDIVTGAATASFCLGPSGWRR